MMIIAHSKGFWLVIDYLSVYECLGCPAAEAKLSGGHNTADEERAPQSQHDKGGTQQPERTKYFYVLQSLTCVRYVTNCVCCKCLLYVNVL